MSKPSTEEFNRMLREMRSSYIDELPQRFGDIERYILNLNTADDFIENYEALYRAVHSIKGSAGTHGLHFISTICHNLEDKITEFAGDQTPVTEEQINNSLALVDLLTRTTSLYATYEDDFSGIEKELELLRHKEKGIKYTALLVETSSIHQQMTEQVFAGSGFNFARVTDGYEALGRLLTEPFDLLITSKQLPRLDGIALIGALRLSESINKKIPTVLLTSAGKHEYTRNTDPDFVVFKDSSMVTQLTSLAKDIEFLLEDNSADNSTKH